MFLRLSVIAAVALAAAGCGGGGRTARVPAAAWTKYAAPHGYRVEHVWHADLTGGRVRDIVVSSVGPFRRYPLPGNPSDLRVLVLNSRTDRWRVAFDAQKVVSSTPCTPATSPSVCTAYLGGSGAPLLDPHAADSVGSVRFAHLESRRRDDLVFQADTAAGSATPVTLAVVHFFREYPSLDYTWSGAHGMSWRIARRQIHGEAGDARYGPAECCATRNYRFTVAPRGEFGEFVETSDDRAWLGVTIKFKSGSETVAGVDANSPSRSALQLGDVLLHVLTPHRKWPRMTFAQELGQLKAGQIARLLVKRDGRQIVVTVRLDSLKASIPELFSNDSLTGFNGLGDL